MATLVAICLPLSVLGSPACADGDLAGSIEFQQAVGLYEAGWGGSDEALIAAVDRLEGLLNSRSGGDFLVRAYYGSACIARARTVSNLQKRRWIQRGVSQLETAVERDPGNVQVRLLRAVTLVVLPRIFGQAETVQEDFDWLIARLEETPILGLACRQEILYHAGSFALRNRDSRALVWLEEAVEIGGEGNMDIERIERTLQLARRQVSLKDRWQYEE